MLHASSLAVAQQRALALHGAGDLVAARELLMNAVEFARPPLSADHPDALGAAHLLARLHREADDPSAARRVLEGAITAGERSRPSGDPLMLALAFELGSVADELGNRHEARRNFARVAAVGPAVLGADHPAVRTARQYLGDAAHARQLPVLDTLRSGLAGQRNRGALDDPTGSLVTPSTLADASTEASGSPSTRNAGELVSGGPGAATVFGTRDSSAGSAGSEPALPLSSPARAASHDHLDRPEVPPVDRARSAAAPTASGIPPVAAAAVPGLPAAAPHRGRPGLPLSSDAPPDQGPSRSPTADPAPNRHRVALVVAVVAVLVALASMAGVGLLLLDRQAAPPAQPSPPTQGRDVRPPGDLTMRDDTTTITLTWADPSDGLVPFLVAGGRTGQTLGVMATVDAGQTSYTVNGLSPRVNYCFAVLAVHDTDQFAASDQVCTSR
ncbi:tetratricopeptide repeat protein [Micromonospora sp. HNM0581]|uniref:fibronectin type III domain-containing protein n=1 Tax=Micromonospora sp. HNM0581 TaxID=2716341 RepID=UPI003216EA1E